MSRSTPHPAGGRGDPAAPRAGRRPSARSLWQQSPLFLLVLIAVSVFLAEGTIMYLLQHFFPPLAPRTEGLLDAALLTAVVFPALYLLLFRPLRRSLTELTQANQELDKGERALLNVLADLKASDEVLHATQLQLIQVAKLESVGQLAAGVAHEVKNPLAVISQGIDFLSQGPATEEQQRQLLTWMRNAVTRADLIVRGLLDFSRPAELVLRPTQLSQVVDAALGLVEKQLTVKDIAVSKELATDLPLVLIDQNQIKQVLINLLINAFQAMPQGGRLSLRVYRKTLTESDVDRAVGQAGLAPGDSALLCEVRDTGHGIPKEMLSKVFDPFFTTKEPGQGTGLGLTITRAIVERHRGRIAIQSEEGIGTLVTLILPLASHEPVNQARVA